MNRAENETETSKRPIRADGPYAQEPTSRSPLQAVCGEGDMANQTPTREDAAAGGILEGDTERHRVPTSKRRTQWYLGTERELQRWGPCPCHIH